MKPALICYGDCQAETLAKAAAADLELSHEFDVLHVWGRVSWVSPETIHYEKETWERCAILWRGNTYEPPVENALRWMPSNAKTVVFPAIHLSAPWPTLTSDPEFPPGPEHWFGQFPFIDRALLKLASGKLPREALFGEYLLQTSGLGPAADRLLERDAQFLVRCGFESDFEMAGFILSRFRTENMFSAPGHPRRSVMRELMNRLAEATWPSDTRVTGKFAGLGSRNPLLSSTDPLRIYDLPISPSVAERLGLTWWSEDMLYRIVDRHGETRNYTIAEYVQSYVETKRANAGATTVI